MNISHKSIFIHLETSKVSISQFFCVDMPLICRQSDVRGCMSESEYWQPSEEKCGHLNCTRYRHLILLF